MFHRSTSSGAKSVHGSTHDILIRSRRNDARPYIKAYEDANESTYHTCQDFQVTFPATWGYLQKVHFIKTRQLPPAHDLAFSEGLHSSRTSACYIPPFFIHFEGGGGDEGNPEHIVVNDRSRFFES